MKKLLLFIIFMLGSKSMNSQINLTGESYYKLNIIGYMGRGNNACGSIDGLKEIKVFYEYGTPKVIWSGRKIYEDINEEVIYNENNKIIKVELKKTIRWSTTFSCDGGPDTRYNIIENISPCFSYYDDDAGDGLKQLTITSKPYVKIGSQSPLFLGSKETLDINIPSNINDSFFNWKYNVNNGTPRNIPNAYNNKSNLIIKGEDFLLETEYGHEVNVWVEMNCSAGLELAKGIAKRDAYREYFLCTRDCSFFDFTCRMTCLQNYNPDGNMTQDLINEHQSINSTPIHFTYLNSAPHIVDKKEVAPLCLGDTGSVKIYFDRNIDPNEALYYVLYDSNEIIGYTTGPDPQPIYLPIDNNTAPITAFTPDGNGGYYIEITDLPPSNSYLFEFIGFGRDTQFGGENNDPVTLPNSEYNGAPLYTGAINHQTTIIIERPVPVEFVSISSKDVMCNGGSDGEITIEAKGGTENYLYQIESNGTYSTAIPFTNQYTHTITGLQAGAYSIKIQDTHGCVASVIEYDPNTNEPISLGDEIIKSVTINEPAPLVITIVDTLHPRAFGFKDGHIKIKMEGGTPENGPYTVEWTNENGAILTGVLKETVNGDYYETLQNLPEGLYTATITDDNYNNTSDNQGCTAVIAQQLIQPEKLTVTLLETNPIYCNTENSNDEFKINSGELTAYASGGVPFKNGENGGLPYIYTWTVEDENGNLQTIYNSTGQAVKDSILGNIGKGMYHLNIEDANGVILGEYPNQTLIPVTPKDSIIELKEPAPILLDFSKKDVFCNSGNDGYAEVSVTGGNPPYDIIWSTGEKTARINSLIAGSYIAYVTDKNGCFTSEKVIIDQPAELSIRIDEQKPPICADGNDGAIAITVDGGVGSYEYLWNNNETSPRIDQLSAGTYSVQIKDGQGCVAFKEFVLENPEPVLVDLGSDRILCNDQQINLDVTLNNSEAQYQWESDNGFTSSSPAVSLSEAGYYKVTVTTPEGCMGTDDITLGFSNTDIDSYFLLASQAFVNEEVILVNVSYPESESVEWFAPDDAEVIASSKEGLILKFKEKGPYTILMRAYIGNCYMDFEKSIIVEEPADLIDIGDADSPFIIDFKAVPNPSNGNFKVSIALAETCDVSLRLFNILTASMTNEKRLSNSDTYEVDYQLSIPSGTYLLLMETPKENRTIKVIIN